MKPIELLVVDNNVSDIYLIRVALAMEPYPINFRLATNSNRADQMLAGNGYQPDLVIFDLNFGKPSNLSLLESIDPYVPSWSPHLHPLPAIGGWRWILGSQSM